MAHGLFSCSALASPTVAGGLIPATVARGRALFSVTFGIVPSRYCYPLQTLCGGPNL